MPHRDRRRGRQARELESLHEIIVKACRPVMLTAIANVNLTVRPVKSNHHAQPETHRTDRIMSERSVQRRSDTVSRPRLACCSMGLSRGCVPKEGSGHAAGSGWVTRRAGDGLSTSTRRPAPSWRHERPINRKPARCCASIACCGGHYRLVKESGSSGRRTNLLTEFGNGFPVGERLPRGWPGNPRALSAMLRRGAPYPEGGQMSSRKGVMRREAEPDGGMISPNRPVPSERAPMVRQPYLRRTRRTRTMKDPGPYEEPDRQCRVTTRRRPSDAFRR